MMRSICVKNNVVAISVDYRRYVLFGAQSMSYIARCTRADFEERLSISFPWLSTMDMMPLSG